MALRVFAVWWLIATQPALAQTLSATDCAQIQATYGVLPSSCTQPNAATASGRPPGDFSGSAAVPITEPTQEMRQSNIFFAARGAELDATALLQLQRLADLLNSPEMQRVCLRLTGHSDATGGNLVNTEMGAKRAAIVRNRLTLLLNNPARIEIVESLGEESHLPGLSIESPWQRRVTLWARDCPW